MSTKQYPSLEDVIGNTPLVRLQRILGPELAARGNVLLGKLEGNNPAGSVKDRPALSMIRMAEQRGRIKPGDTLIEATSGNTGIALAMAAAMRGYRMILIMPENQSVERCQTMRAYGALRMGLIKDVAEAAKRQHTPKIAFVAPPQPYVASSGKRIEEAEVLVRALSMGKLHHAMMATCAVAIATAASVPGTLVNLAAGGQPRESVRFGHPSGTLRVGAKAEFRDGQWSVTKAIMSRSARVLMEGFVRVPGDTF